MKKFTSVLLALMLVIGMFAFTSCEKAPDALLEDAEKALEEKPYTMTMKMNFSSDNKEVNNVFKMMNMEMPFTIDGDNLAMDTSVEVMGETMQMKMTLVNKVLYYDVAFAGQSEKMKANLSDAQYKEFKGDQSAEMPVDYSQFSELTAEKKDGKTIIKCTGLTEEGRKALNDEMDASINGMGGSAELGDFTYTITLKDGKYESMDLSCSYTVSVEDESISVTMTMGADFEYEGVEPITVPEDAASYKSVDYDDLIGE